ncbi:hypothetical protein NYE69_33300 [Paenibacillus sp. FSL R5-0527]|uniref:hypothetical protein n=1 Tax=Paenibacillus sp. FSL R5-0527 TaxID=2975321 RepID=UPI00097AFD29|nr:hypothetical protein BK140_33005 [Paenibacillus macerans]
MRLFRNILAIISFVVSALLVIIALIMALTSDTDTIWVPIVFGVIFLVIGLVLKTKNQSKRNVEMSNDGNGTVEYAIVHHVEGLPISEKTRCQIELRGDNLAIKGGGVDFNLNSSQITAVEIKTDVEIANIVSSSAAKGIAGGLLFGPIGLVVGSRATNKVKRTLHYYLIINYFNSSGELSAMMFQDNIAPRRTRKLVNSLRSQLPSAPKRIDL